MQHENNHTTKPMIVFGDIHGLSHWKKVVAENPNCRFLFLGDYLDPYTDISHNILIENLKKIIQLKIERSDEVILLIGNHDLHYIYLNIYPCTRFDDEIEEAAHALFSENRGLFQFAFQENKHIFTHAGISEKWFFDDFGGDKSFTGGILWADID